MSVRPARRNAPPRPAVATDRRASPPVGRTSPPPAAPFDVHEFLETAGVARRIVEFRHDAMIFTQGDPADAVLYLKTGSVKLSVVSSSGKEAVVAILGPGEFFGEGCLAGQPNRMGSACAVELSSMLLIEKEHMRRVLHEEASLSDLFIAYVLARNLRVEEDLVDQLFNKSEKRLARTLLLLAHCGQAHDVESRVLPKVTQETLAEMVGTTRSRVNFFMKKFRRLGFLEYNGGIRVNHSLLSVVLHD